MSKHDTRRTRNHPQTHTQLGDYPEFQDLKNKHQEQESWEQRIKEEPKDRQR